MSIETNQFKFHSNIQQLEIGEPINKALRDRVMQTDSGTYLQSYSYGLKL
jgi:hypothetical protein